MKNKNLIAVEGRTDSYYSLVETNTGIKRVWDGGNTLYLSEEQIRDLATSYGGRTMFEKHLLVHDKELMEEILGHPLEIEYSYNKETILALLKNGTEAQLKDALEFSPEGVKELIRLCAIETRLPDNNKIKIISEALSIDLAKTIEFDFINLEDNESANEKESTSGKKRMTEPFTLNVNKDANKSVNGNILFPPLDDTKK